MKTDVGVLNALRWLGPLIALVMAGVICLVSGRHRLRSLALGLLLAAACLGVVWLGDYATPVLIGTGLGATPLKVLATPIRQGFTGPLQAANHLYLIAILVLLVTAALLEVAQVVVRHLYHPAAPPKPPKTTKAVKL